MVISKKVAAKAVARNLLKRRGMAVLREFLKKYPGFSLAAILFAKKGAEDLSFAAQKEELYSLLSSLPKPRN